MKKIVLMSLQTAKLEISQARYQLLEELAGRGFETYVFFNGIFRQRKKFPSVHHVIDVSCMSNKEIRNRIIKIEPQVVIASTYEDVKAIYILPWIKKDIMFCYYNLEIYTPYVPKIMRKNDVGKYLALKIVYPINKIKEIIYLRKVKVFTIQDKLRCKVSAKYHIKHKNTMLIPNSYVFNINNIDNRSGKGVIYTGAISKWALGNQFEKLNEVKKIPITFAGWVDSEYNTQIAHLKKTNPNITFVAQQLTPEEHTEYLRHYAVGLIWYGTTSEDENVFYMGLASGKMFKYLSMGKPVIAVKYPGISNEIRKYKLGVVINDISEMDKAYVEIMENYAYYHKNVIATYKNLYDFKRAIIPFLDYIEMSENMNN